MSVVFAVVLPTICAVFEGPNLFKAWKTYAWIPTEYTVVSVTPVRQTDVRGRHVRAVRDRYRVDIEYSYEFEGRSYLGTRYSVSYRSAKGKYYSADAARSLPLRGEEFCYVNPKDPDEAVIKRGFDRSHVLGMAIVSLHVFSFGIFLPIAVRWQVAKQRKVMK